MFFKQLIEFVSASMASLRKKVLLEGEPHQHLTTSHPTNIYQEVNLAQEANPTTDQLISIELRILDRDMAKQIMVRTILLLESTAKNTNSEDERRQALLCIAAIKQDNPSLKY
uniref:(northern house mosquito) hypothetical protein n=1 Tax=Culex pipiens TaxID=7175 RepID=A0A8D8JPW5_CULPI